MNRILLFAALLFTMQLAQPALIQAQSPGLIVRPAGGNGVTILNPNGDGYSSATTAGFTTSDITQSEILYKIVPPIVIEPTGDLATGPSGGFTDIVKTVDNSGFYTYFDGTNLLFRLRIGSIISGSKGYSILIDTDGKMGSTGPNADPNYVAPTSSGSGNPGFEYEVVLQTNFNVSVYNVDGVQNPVLITSYSLNTNSQLSVALSTDSGNPDYFYDFGIPITAIGSPTSFRMAATTVISPNSALQGSRSDIYGIDDSNTKPATAWENVINSQPPTTTTSISSGGSGPGATCTQAPTINSPITTGSNVSVSGTWTRLDVSKPSTATITLYKNGVSTGTTTVSTGGTWNIVVSSVAAGDVYYAKAQSTGESMCLQSASITAGCASVPTAPVLTCASSKGISGTIQSGNTILIYQMPTTAASATSIPLTTNITYPTSTSFAYYVNGCSGGTSNVGNGTYMLMASNGSCNSAPVFECISSGSSSLVGLSTNALTVTTPIYPYQTSISGTGAASGNILHLFVNGQYNSTITATGAAFTFSGLTLKANDVIKIYNNTGVTCMTVSNPFTVSCYTQPPVITTNSAGKLLTSATSISGTSIYSGATVTLYKGTAPSGVVTGSPATTASDGSWTISGLTLTSGDNYYATIASGGCTSPASGAASVLAPTTTCPVIVGSYNETSTLVTGTLPIAFTGTVRLYLDGVQIGSTSVAAGLAWTINSPFTYPLYPNGVLSVTAQTTGNAENSGCASTATISCTSPSTPSISPTSSTIHTGNTVTYTINNITANSWYALLDNNGVSYATSVYKTGTTSFNITTNAFSTAGTYNLKLSADKLTGCASAFQAASVTVSSTLPATLTAFDGSWVNGSVLLKWSTASEMNVSRFEIERSFDGSVYGYIGTVNAAGNSRVTNNYAFTDQYASGNNVLYYRLKMIDQDGVVKYSKILVLKADAIVVHAVWPNPFINEMTVSVTLDKKQSIAIRIADAEGKTVYQRNVEGVKGLNTISVKNLDRLSKGIYILSIKAGDRAFQQKLMKLTNDK